MPNLRRLLNLAAVSLISLLASPVFAQGIPGGGINLDNPLADSGINTIQDLIGKIVLWLTGIIGILALLALVWAGFRMVTAFGNDKQVAQAKTIILWAVIGLGVVILAWVIILTTSQLVGGV